MAKVDGALLKPSVVCDGDDHDDTERAVDVGVDQVSGIVAVVTAVDVRVGRMEEGNFGDGKPVREGVSEMRIDVGTGYRVYYARAGNEETAVELTVPKGAAGVVRVYVVDPDTFEGGRKQKVVVAGGKGLRFGGKVRRRTSHFGGSRACSLPELRQGDLQHRSFGPVHHVRAYGVPAPDPQDRRSAGVQAQPVVSFCRR